MYCSNCGNSMPDGTQYCPMCGAVQDVAPQAPVNYPNSYPNPTYPDYGAGQMPTQKKSPVAKFVVIGVVAVAAIALIAVICSALFSSGSETALKKFCKAIEKGDGEAVVEVMYPEDSTQYSNMMEYADEYVENMADMYGDDLDISYDVRKEEKLDSDTLEDLGDYLESHYDLDADQLSKAYLMQVKLTLAGDDDKDTEKMWIVTYKYDGNWYLDSDLYTSVDSIYDLKSDLS